MEKFPVPLLSVSSIQNNRDLEGLCTLAEQHRQPASALNWEPVCKCPSTCGRFLNTLGSVISVGGLQIVPFLKEIQTELSLATAG